MSEETLSSIPGAGLDHIGIAVRDLEASIELFKQLGLTPSNREVITEQGVELVILPVGETHLELLCPMGEDTPVGKFISHRGEGLHHIALKVKDIQSTLERYIQKGYRAIDEVPRIGAGGSLIAFLDPRSTGGVLIELTQSDD